MYWEVINIKTGHVLSTGWRYCHDAEIAFNELVHYGKVEPHTKVQFVKVWSGDANYWEKHETPIP